MALSSSPRKLVIPLASGDESRPRTSSLHASRTKRVFYAGVVVEGSENGRRIPDEIQDLVLSLGNAVVIPDESLELRPTTSNQLLNDIDAAAQRKRALQDPGALASVINELVTSERSYVRRLQILKNDYADPLRNFSRNKDTAIIPPYEAKTLFGNIDNLLPVNEAFLTDLEKMIGPNGAQVVGGVGDVCLRHFRELRGFEQYKQFYVKREDAQAIFEKEASKKSSRFSQYIDRIKYQTVENRNRVGLRELLMEPVQRIPRYTLLFRTMLKHMSPEDPQRQKLIEADDIASKIAQAETDEKTRRATIYSCLSAAMEGFPAELFSSERKYIDCIDVEDIVTDAPSSSSSSNGMMTLHATLFLFEDKLLIAKRMSTEKSGYVLAGLNNVEKLAKSGLVPPKGRKHTLSYKGMMDITDVVATDTGGADLNLFLETTPQDVSDRWNGRPFRHYSVIHPPGPINVDPIRTESDKQRFLENLWHTQAVFRARAGQSVVLCSDEQEVENRGHRTTVAKTYYNVYQRTAYLQELKKNKVVVHIDKDRSASADPLPVGEDGDPPHVIIRINLMDGGLCRYNIRSSDPNDEGEEEIVKTPKVSSRITQTINQFGLFEFKTGRNSMPTTPTARSKVAIFGLDALSRGLFNGRPGSVGDFFAGSINGNKRNRSRSTASRSSMYTQTTQTTTTADSMKFSHRSSASTLTAATSVSSIEDDVTAFGARGSGKQSSSMRAKSQSRSRGVSPSDSERGSVSRRSGSTSRPQSRNSNSNSAYAVDMLSDYEDADEDYAAALRDTQGVRTSDLQLAMQLELARQNSLQHGNNRMVPMQLEAPSQETIYEETSPFSQRNGDMSSRRSIVCRSEYSTTSTLESPPATARPMSMYSTTDHGRPMSVHSTSERRPHGPRSPSPLPPPRGLQTQDSQDSSAWEDEEVDFPSSSSRPPVTPGIRRSIRQPLFHGAQDATPKARPPSGIPVVAAAAAATPIEPLSIKKKTSLRSASVLSTSPTLASKKAARGGSPLSKSLNRVVSPRRVSPTFVRRSKLGASASSAAAGPAPSAALVKRAEEFEHLRSLAVSTQEDIESSRQTLKRIKTQTENLKAAAQNQNQGEGDQSRSSSPEKFPRSSTPQPVFQPPLTKAAQERLEEMRNLIGRRQVEGVVARSRPRSGTLDTPTRNNALATPETNNFVRSVEGFIAQIEKDLNSAESHANTLTAELARYSDKPTQNEVDLERVKQELASSRRAHEVIKELLDDCNAEKEIMYTLFIEAFNDELEQLYNDINLPNHEDALRAVTNDLKTTIDERQDLRRENTQLRHKVAMADLKNQELVDLLLKHGIPVPEEFIDE